MKNLPVELYLEIISKMNHQDIIKLCNTNSHAKKICADHKKFVARTIFKDLNYNVSGISNLSLLFSRFYIIDKKLLIKYENIYAAIDTRHDDVLQLLINNIDLTERYPNLYKIDHAVQYAIHRDDLNAIKIMMPYMKDKEYAPVYALKLGNIEAFKILSPYFAVRSDMSLGENIVLAVVENKITNPKTLGVVIRYALSVDPSLRDVIADYMVT